LDEPHQLDSNAMLFIMATTVAMLTISYQQVHVVTSSYNFKFCLRELERKSLGRSSARLSNESTSLIRYLRLTIRTLQIFPFLNDYSCIAEVLWTIAMSISYMYD
jgi:hypothetical protein